MRKKSKSKIAAKSGKFLVKLICMACNAGLGKTSERKSKRTISAIAKKKVFPAWTGIFLLIPAALVVVIGYAVKTKHIHISNVPVDAEVVSED